MCLYTVFFLQFSLILGRQKQFSKQFQPWHLLVQCLPQSPIHICSLHKLDPIRWHQTKAYTSTSLAQRQGPRTIRKCFFFHYGASDPLKGVYLLRICQPLFPKGGFSCGWGVKVDEDNDVIGSTWLMQMLFTLHCTPESWETDGLDCYPPVLYSNEIKPCFTAVIIYSKAAVTKLP